VGCPFEPILASKGFVLLDGGLATELEARGHDLGDDLWSARLLAEDPEEIRAVHRAYREAGADCVITASYQATVEGFRRQGKTREEAASLLQLSVDLARGRGLTAASIGPYGAALADGSEYTGDYPGMTEQALYDFHASRFRILAESGADLLACETIPSFPEAQALARLLDESRGVRAWFSFSCRNDAEISDGTPIGEAAALLADRERLSAVGVNCTAPRHIEALIAELRAATQVPILVYPNSGERYDQASRTWSGTRDPVDFARAALRWRDAGASILGGCCRTGPEHIRRMREALRP
jgi:homocysteine S-methyltransferase